MLRRLLILGTSLLAVCSSVHGQSSRPNSLDVLLHSNSLNEQRDALAVILRNTQEYVPLIRQSLQNYPQLLVSDEQAANRAVYVSALVRDPSFAPILAGMLGDEGVLSECEYACPVVFALTIDASFGGWNPPPDLNTSFTTVADLKDAIRNARSIVLQVRPIEDVVQGPALERHRKEIDGKSEEELIRMAGPLTASFETRVFSAYRLETSVVTSKNRVELYLLALNAIRDASGEYRDAIYHAIERAELANSKAKSR